MTLPQRIESAFKRLAEVEKEKWEVDNVRVFNSEGTSSIEILFYLKSESVYGDRTFSPQSLSSDDCDEIAGELGMEIEVFNNDNGKYAVFIRPSAGPRGEATYHKCSIREARIEGLIKAVELYVEGKKQ